MCSAQRHVRFTPNSDLECEIPQKAMSALPPKADMCSAKADVCYGPKADIKLMRIAAPSKFDLDSSISAACCRVTHAVGL